MRVRRRSICVLFIVILLTGVLTLAAVPGHSISIPLVFEENRGQAPEEVHYLARGKGFTLLLSPSTAEIVSDHDSIRLTWIGGNGNAILQPEELLLGRSNYFKGSDPSDWVTNVRHYRKARYRDVYPGIDLVFYGNPHQLEYDFVVEPGADPGLIRMGIEGSRSVLIDGTRLVAQTNSGKLVQHRPRAYQTADEGQSEVSVAYQLEGSCVSFELGEFDRSRPLAIDPVVTLSTLIGGSGTEQTSSIASDAAGNIYIAGGLDRPFDAGAFDSAYTDIVFDDGDSGGSFLLKLNPSTREIVYFTVVVTGCCGAGGLAVDQEGNAYITGITTRSDLPMVNPAQSQHGGGSEDAFIIKLNPSGDQILYSTYFGAEGAEEPNDLVIDALGAVYITGRQFGEGLPTVNAFDDSFNGGPSDVFFAKLSPDGQTVEYASYLGGSSYESASSIAIGRDGIVYIAGQTGSSDFPLLSPIKSAYSEPPDAGADAFITAFLPDGRTLVFSTYFGGSSIDTAGNVLLGPDDDLWISGETQSEDFPLVDAFQAQRAGQTDAFVTRLQGDGSLILYSTYFGGSGRDGGGVGLDELGRIYLAGNTSSTDLPLVEPSQTVLQGENDTFRARFSPDGSSLEYSTYWGGAGFDGLVDFHVNPQGTAYLTGIAEEGFPTVDPLEPNTDDSWDVFLLVIAQESADSDSDGIDDSIEDGAPNGGDGNDDGTPDREQAYVASLPSDRTAEYVTLAAPEGTSLGSVAFIENPSPGDKPAGVVFPLGFLSFALSGLPGGAVSVELLLPAGSSIDTYYKFGPTPDQPLPHWYDFSFDGTTGAEIFPGRIVLHFVDGGRGDDDLQADGTISEPGGPAQLLSGAIIFPQIVDGTTGSIKFQSSLLLTNTGEDTVVEVHFHSSPDGSPMEVELGDLGTASSFQVSLARGQSITLDSPGTGSLKIGYARVFGGEGIDGILVFARTDSISGIRLFDTGVPAAPPAGRMTVITDYVGARSSGLALVNPADGSLASAAVTLRLYSPEFTLLGETHLDPLAAGAHLARFVDELFDDQAVKRFAEEMQGILTVESDRPLAAVTLRQTDEPGVAFPAQVPSLTTFPVVEDRADPASAVSKIRVKALMDGLSRLTLRRDTAQWHHLNWAAPGRHEGRFEPTIINGYHWQPRWPDNPDAENRSCDCESSMLRGIIPPLPQGEVQLEVVLGRGDVSVVQSPTAENDFTLILEVDDNGFGGSDYYIVDLILPDAQAGEARSSKTNWNHVAERRSWGERIANQEEPNTFYFPQLVDGSAGDIRFQSTFILTNTGQGTDIIIDYFSTPDGQPMVLELEGLSGSGTGIGGPLGTGESVSFPTRGTGELQSGYAKVVANSTTEGLLVFSRVDLATGIRLYESGVPAVKPLEAFTVLVDSIGDRNTGLALVHPGAEDAPDANLVIRLYDQDYALIGERALAPLAPGAHLARFVNELFEEEAVRAIAAEMQGILTVSGDQPVVAVTLRQTEPAQGFPAGVPALTTFPVIPRVP